MITPIRESLCIFSKAIVENGISLGASKRGFLSLRATAATRVARLALMPQAIFANVFILQGIIEVASTQKEPEDTHADISSSSCRINSLDSQ